MQKKNKKSWMLHFISVLIILGFFAVASLVLSYIGIRVYQNIVISNNDNFELRTSLSYIVTKIRQTDNNSAEHVKQRDGVTILALEETIDGRQFETLIYHYDGYLRELFHEIGAEYELDYGIQMLEIADFKIEETQEGFISLTAENKAGDIQSLMVSLRTGR